MGDNLYDAYTVAFGIRNMTHMDAVSILDSALYLPCVLGWVSSMLTVIKCDFTHKWRVTKMSWF